jgi:hypothetical protein
MVTAHKIQTRRDIVKPVQYASEGDTVVTPPHFGVLPAGPSLAMTALGHVRDLTLQPDIQRIDTEVLGSEDIVNAIKTGRLYAFQVVFEPTDEAMLQVAVDASGGGVGTIDESYRFMFSELLDGVENYTNMTGCRPTNTQARLNQGVWECTQTWVCKEITVPNPTDPMAASTPVYVAEPTASSISHSAVADHWSYNAVTYPDSSFSLNVTRNLATETVNGEELIVYTAPVSREVEYTIETYVKANTLEQESVDITERASVYKFDATFDFTFTNCVISSHSRAKSASGTDAYKENLTVRAEGVTLA